MRKVSTKRVVMTRGQSLLTFGNPYGDDANMMLIALNAAWKARVMLAATYPSITLPMDADIKELVEYLREHEQARPWQFDTINGYQYVDLSESNWEGHYSNY